MRKVKVNYMYDPLEDNMFIFREPKSYGSVEVGENIIIDFDPKMNIVGLEFFQASKILSHMTNTPISKAQLKQATKVDLYADRIGGILMAHFSIQMPKANVNEKIGLQDFQYESPMIARKTKNQTKNSD